MPKKRIPKNLQSVLWSADVGHLDLGKDKGYIIHQIFAYGLFDDILWLFKTYPKKVLRRVFMLHPYKDYRAGRFHLVKNYLLGLGKQRLAEKNYVKNIPRDLR